MKMGNSLRARFFRHFSIASLILLLAQTTLINALFEYKSDASLQRMQSIRLNFDQNAQINSAEAMSGMITPEKIAQKFWTVHRADYDFLMNQAHSIIEQSLEREKIELELMMTDPLVLEDLMDFDSSSILAFLQVNPTILNMILQEPNYREMLKRHLMSQYLTPLFNRITGTVSRSKLNST